MKINNLETPLILVSRGSKCDRYRDKASGPDTHLFVKSISKMINISYDEKNNVYVPIKEYMELLNKFLKIKKGIVEVESPVLEIISSDTVNIIKNIDYSNKISLEDEWINFENELKNK